ncbi:hypothetical protein AX16_003219 [Volvariella volvacea WC 439]|nr:hypothetical protein AX16_003219 [Volvariella volvacea WC 439]
MRIRIQTTSPLPELKAWFIPEASPTNPTIDSLKAYLCTKLPILQNARVAGPDLVLSLEGFELLDGTPMDVIRDESQRVPKRKRSGPITIPGRSVAIPRNAPPSSKLTSRREKSSKSKSPVTLSSSGDEKSNSSEESDSDSESSESSSSEDHARSNHKAKRARSSSTSSEDSSSELSDSSEASSSSSTTASSPPTIQPTKPTNPPAKSSVQTPSLNPNMHYVPPGYGSVQTHSRNIRRRRKRKIEKQLAQAANAHPSQPPKGTSSSNITPLGPAPSTSTRTMTKRDLYGPAGDVASALNNAFSSNDRGGALHPGTVMDADGEPERGSSVAPQPVPAPSDAQASRSMSVSSQPREVMMASFGNKNKRKGFKNSLHAPVPAKIVFSDDFGQETCSAKRIETVESKESSSQSKPETKVEPVAASTSDSVAKPRLIPPSEKQERGEIPPNLFVTSVDVEEGKWNKRGRKRQQRAQKENWQNGTRWAEERRFEDADEGDITLVYPQEGSESNHDNLPVELSVGAISQSAAVSNGQAVSWGRVDQEWKTFREVASGDQLVVGGLYCWEGLGMNPETFAPEKLLIVARVVRLNKQQDLGLEVVIRQVHRPGTSAIGFSSTKLKFAQDEAMQVDEDTEGDEEVIEWNTIAPGSWRVVNSY